jgi:hypothetical protein
MFLRTLLYLTILPLVPGPFIASSQTASSIWTLTPKITQRRAKPDIWTLDLRGKTPEQAAAEAGRLSARIYGGDNTGLSHPLVIRTDFATPKLLAFELQLVSSSGSDLVITSNGAERRRFIWPSAKASHRVGKTIYFSLAGGDATTAFEVTKPDGVVVINHYYIADAVSQLPGARQAVALDAFQPESKSGKARTPEPALNPEERVLATDDGYRGIWYSNQRLKNQYHFKYSGGMATYPQQRAPIAIYCKAVDKTFFVYGGTTARSASDPQDLLHMISYYDHKTGMVPRPRVLLDKHTGDAHDNPALQIDDAGYLWIFSPSHGTARPSFIHRSVKPWSIDAFKEVKTANFSYTEPWYIPGKGFLFLHTRYGGGRSVGINAERVLFWSTSRDGMDWSPSHLLAGISQGDYQVSWPCGERVATAFDFHPSPLGLNGRANIYYLETADQGQTWRKADGTPVKLPLTSTNNPALIYDSRAEGLLVYLKDVNFDAAGHPVILYLTSKGYEPGPATGPRQWQTMRWDGSRWIQRPFTTSGNNYDHGSLYIEPDGVWRIIGATETGPLSPITSKPATRGRIKTSHSEAVFSYQISG